MKLAQKSIRVRILIIAITLITYNKCITRQFKNREKCRFTNLKPENMVSTTLGKYYQFNR